MAKIKNVAIIVVAALYILSPIDVIPEIALGPLGLVDDAGALVVAAFNAAAALRK